MPVAQIGFLYQTRNLKGSVLSEKKKKKKKKKRRFLVKNRVLNQNSQISEIFPKCILDIKVPAFRLAKQF